MIRNWTRTEKAVGAFVVVVPVAFLSTMTWLERASPIALSIAQVLAASIVMLGGLYLGARTDRRLDEVERAGSRFSTHWGMPIGGMLAVFASMVPLVQDWLAALAGTTEGASGAVMVFIAGICTAIALQTVVSLVAARIWRGRMASPQ